MFVGEAVSVLLGTKLRELMSERVQRAAFGAQRHRGGQMRRSQRHFDYARPAKGLKSQMHVLESFEDLMGEITKFNTKTKFLK